MDEIRFVPNRPLKRLSADGGVGLLKSPHALVPAATDRFLTIIYHHIGGRVDPSI